MKHTPGPSVEESISELLRYNPLQLVAMERIKQDAKWGEQNHDDFEWLSILSEEFGEAGRAVCEQLGSTYSKRALRENLEVELIQTAAVCIAWVECIRRRDARATGEEGK